MAFYDEISKYYDEIFKVSKEQVDFISGIVGSKPKSILDIACGTGNCAIELSKKGYNLTAVDLDSKMIEELSKKTATLNIDIKFSQANMMNLIDKLKDKKFDAIYCIGNSLVHLNDLNEIKEFFMEVKKLLNEDGVFIFQIINYDRILKENIKFLPTINNDFVPLSFKRFYEYDESINKIKFKTILEVEGKKIENEVDLFPLLYEQAIRLLEEVGFKEINAFGNFKKSDFDKESSYALIIEANKRDY